MTIGSVSLSWIDIDDELLTAAMRELGTSTAQETVNAALREVVARRRRLQALHELGEMGKQGAFEAGYEAWRARKGLSTNPGATAAPPTP